MSMLYAACNAGILASYCGKEREKERGWGRSCGCGIEADRSLLYKRETNSVYHCLESQEDLCLMQSEVC